MGVTVDLRYHLEELLKKKMGVVGLSLLIHHSQWLRRGQLEGRWQRRFERQEEMQEQKIMFCEQEQQKLWEQEQKIIFCDVNTLDLDQKTYVLTMRAQIASSGGCRDDGDRVSAVKIIINRSGLCIKKRWMSFPYILLVIQWFP